MAKRFRQFDTNERKFTTANMAVMREQIEELNYDIKMVEFDLTQGIDLKARASKRTQRERLKQLARAIKEIEFAISNSERQLKEGVEIKDDSKEEAK